MFVLLLNWALILGGTCGGLILSNADPLFWMVELPLALLFCLTLSRATTVTSATMIATILGMRVYALLILSILGATTLLTALEHWPKLIGFLGGSFIGLWFDLLNKFRRDNVQISLTGRVVIALKWVAIFMLDIVLLAMGQSSSNMMLYISVLVASHFFGATLIELISSNIRGAIGQQIPLTIGQLKLYALLDCLVSGVFFTVALMIDKSLLGFTICASTHIIVTALGFLQVKALKKHSVVMQKAELKPIVVVVNPSKELNFCIGIPLHEKPNSV